MGLSQPQSVNWVIAAKWVEWNIFYSQMLNPKGFKVKCLYTLMGKCKMILQVTAMPVKSV